MSYRNRPAEEGAIRDRHRALLILRLIQRDGAGRMNDELLRSLLRLYAFIEEREALREALDRLEPSGLVERVESAPSVVVVQLTERGERVALGEAEAEGVQRAWPDCPY